MKGGNFLVSLQEVLSSKKNILWNSLLKEDTTCCNNSQTMQFLTLSVQIDGDLRQLIHCVRCEVMEIFVKMKHFISWVRECITRIRKGQISLSACFTWVQGMILQNFRFISIFACGSKHNIW